jgi:hypothetical protein
MKRLQAQEMTCDQIPVERFHMAQIKNQAVPFRNRTVVKRVAADPGEEIVRSSTRLGKPKDKGVIRGNGGSRRGNRARPD